MRYVRYIVYGGDVEPRQGRIPSSQSALTARAHCTQPAHSTHSPHTAQHTQHRGGMQASLSADIKAFARGSLRPQTTRVTTLGGLSYTEGPGAAHVETGDAAGPREASHGRSLGFVPDWRLDLQVGVVKPWLLLGSQDVAQDIRTLQQHKVTHILNVAYGVDNTFPDSFIYKTVTMLDVPDTKLTSYFPECFDFISQAHKQGGVVLVHCNAGVSRAASVVIGYLMQEDGLLFQDAFALVKRARPAAHPNAGFMQQLKEYSPGCRGQNGESEVTELLI